MNEIERLNPGLVVRSESSAAGRTISITGRTASAVEAEIARRRRRGEVEQVGPLEIYRSGPYRGHLYARVVLRPGGNQAQRAIPRGAKVASLLLGSVAAVVASFAWLLSAMSAAALAAACVALLVGLAAVLLAGRGKPGGNVTVISNINVRGK